MERKRQGRITWKMRKTKRTEIFLLCLICLLALFLQTNALLKGLDHDDVWSIEVMQNKLSNLARMDVIPADEVPVHYIMLHFWTKLFGVSEIALRMLSVLFGLLSVPMIYLTGKRFFSGKVGLMSAFLLSISVYLIENAQLIRAYSVFLFFSLLSIYFFGRYIKEFKRRDLVLFTIASIINFYTHFFASFLLDIQILFFFVFIKKRRKEFLVSILSVLLFALPVLLRMKRAFIYNQSSVGQNLAHLFTFLNSIHYNAIHSTLIIFLLVLFIIGLRRSYKTNKNITILAAMTFFIPLAIAVLISFLNLFKVKHYLFALPLFIILISNGLFKIKRNIRTILLVLLILLSIFALADYYKRPYGPDWKSAFAYINKNSEAGDIATVSWYAERPASYYSETKGIVMRGYSAEQLGGILQHYRRVWILFHDEAYICEKCKTPNLTEVLAYLDNHYKIIDQKIFAGGITLHDDPATNITVYLYEPK